MASSIDPFGYLAYIRKCLRRRGRTPEDAEDLVQEAFLKLELYCREGHEVRQPEAFVMRTALNLSISEHRQKARSAIDRRMMEAIAQVDFSMPPDEVFAAEERLEEIKKLLDDINPRTREVFFMHRLGGFSYAEIAERIGISVSAVEKHIASAASALALMRQKHER